ncbi:Endonuclease, Uma2 family (Restriction endonuclease fold) [Sandaracinus amylolyticus]|nr:Endonuclease, Uma2 family (Restriction endonuclease fold) [Sandaracinus amylolyticus]
MANAAQKLATYEDLLRLPDDVRAEVIGGALELLPAPRPRHSNVQRALGRFVGGPFHDDDGHGGPGGWWIFVEVDIALGPHDVVRPDVSGWRRSRLARPDQRPLSIAPDWVCEILSPSTRVRDRVTKRRLYARHEVSYYWIVDPEARTLEALALDRDHGRWLEVGTYDENDVVRVAPFEAIELPVGRLFLPRDPNEVLDED